MVTNDVTKWKEQVPVGIKSEDWENFCDNEATEYQKELKRNKAIKDSCERKTTHNTGCNGYARAAEKCENENGRAPSRAELWLYTHARNDGTYAPHNQEFADKVKMLLDVFKEKNEEETLDSGPIFETFRKETRGRVRCIRNTISRTSILALEFTREMLKEVNTEKDDWMQKVDILREEVEGVKFTLIEFINDFKSGKFEISPFTSTTTTPTSVTHAPSTSQFPNDLIPCKILFHMGEIVGCGRKTQIGAVALVHGRVMRQREVRIVLDNIKVHDYAVWGGKQGCCSSLEDVGRAGFMFWHDDFLPPMDDTEEQ